MRQLPPLAAVRVFEAAGRHENFTAAAAELGMTQAAVTYQIRLLEDRLGLALFRRERRRVWLTEPGRRALAEVSRAFDVLDGAFAGLRAEDAGVLTLSTTHTFGSTWLAWKLGGFQLRHPDTAVRMLTADALVDFARDEVDVAIRYGRGDWPGLESEPVLPIEFTPMCSPAFLAARGGALSPADLPHLPLISETDAWWAQWLAEVGVERAHRRGGVRLESQAHEGHAAMAGQGLALLTPFLWRNDLAEGRLVAPFAHRAQSHDSYWLVCLPHRRRVPKIARFRAWLLDEITADRAQFG